MSLKLSKRLCFIFTQLVTNYQDTTSWHLQSDKLGTWTSWFPSHMPLFLPGLIFFPASLICSTSKQSDISLIQQNLTCAMGTCIGVDHETAWEAWDPRGQLATGASGDPIACGKSYKELGNQFKHDGNLCSKYHETRCKCHKIIQHHLSRVQYHSTTVNCQHPIADFFPMQKPLAQIFLFS